MMKTLLAVYLVVLLCELVLTAERQGSRLSVLKSKSRHGSQTLLLSMEEARHMVRLCVHHPVTGDTVCVHHPVTRLCISGGKQIT